MNKIFAILAVMAVGPLFAGPTPVQITIEGALVCADSAGSVLPPGDTCPGSHEYALRTDQGKVYFFLGQDPRVEIFHDARVRARRLKISGWERPGNRVEIIKLWSVRDGKLYDIYYYCETCNITSLVGGRCPCCQAEMEFRETPAKP